MFLRRVLFWAAPRFIIDRALIPETVGVEQELFTRHFVQLRAKVFDSFNPPLFATVEPYLQLDALDSYSRSFIENDFVFSPSIMVLLDFGGCACSFTMWSAVPIAVYREV